MRCLRAGYATRCVFPLGFAQQAVAVGAGHAVEPCDVVLRIAPVHVNDRPRATSPPVIDRLDIVLAPAAGNAGIPLIERDRETRYGEWRLDRDDAQVFLAAHLVGTGRNDN